MLDLLLIVLALAFFGLTKISSAVFTIFILLKLFAFYSKSNLSFSYDQSNDRFKQFIK